MILTGIFMVMGHLSYPKFLKELYKVLSYDMPWKASILFLILTKMLCVVGRHNHLTIVRVFHWNGSKVTRVITSCSRNSKSLSLSLSSLHKTRFSSIYICHFSNLHFLQWTWPFLFNHFLYPHSFRPHQLYFWRSWWHSSKIVLDSTWQHTIGRWILGTISDVTSLG